jgi:hypothetical protein
MRLFHGWAEFTHTSKYTWDIFTGRQSLRTLPSTHETFSRVGRVYAHFQVHMRHFHRLAEFMHTSKYTWDIFMGRQSLCTLPTTHETFSRVGRVYAHFQVHMRQFHGWAEFTHTSKYTWDSFTGGQSLRIHPSTHETFSQVFGVNSNLVVRCKYNRIRKNIKSYFLIWFLHCYFSFSIRVPVFLGSLKVLSSEMDPVQIRLIR